MNKAKNITINTFSKCIIIGLLIMLSSCKKDWFDAKPDKSLTVPVNLDDWEKLLDNTLLINSSSTALGEISSDGHFMPEVAWNRLPFNVERNAYAWSYLGPVTESNDWNSNYLKIYYCSLSLEGLAKISNISAKELERYDQCKGNALFTRAFTWYQLAQVYAPPYDSATANNTLSIPLRTESDINIRTVRSTIQETYDKIQGDLLASVDLLPVTPMHKTRGSKAAAFGLLARCNLSMGKYNKALQYADSALKIDNSLMDYNALEPNSQNVGIFNPEVIYHCTLTNCPSIYLPGFVYVDAALYNSYEEDDLRKSVFFLKATDTTIRFKGMYNKNILQFAGLATDEMYLIRSECYARRGDAKNAIADLNTLLIKRYKQGTFKPIEVSTATNALDLILEERKKELLLRGLRWSDLRRLNKDPRYAITITRKVGGTTYSLTPNSPRYTLLFPDDVINLSGIQQNSGW